MTLPLSTFGTALHLRWCPRPTVLLRESLTVTVSIALMFCSRSSLKFQLRSSLWFRAHTQKKSFNRYSEWPWYIAQFLLETLWWEKYQQHCVYIYSFHQGLCSAGATSKRKHVDLISYSTCLQSTGNTECNKN